MSRCITHSRLLSTMARWAGIENNVVFVLKKTLDSKPPEPYRSMMTRFIIRVNSGMDAAKALESELDRVRSPFMRHVLINMVSVIKNNGDLKALLTKFEYEAFKIEETLWSNNVRLYKDRLLLNVLNLMVLLACIRLISKGMSGPWLTTTAFVCMGIGLLTASAAGRQRF